MERLLYVHDIYNNLIFLNDHACDNNNNLIKLSIRQLSKLIKAIREPALILESAENNLLKRYYFRAIHWDQTLLIGVHYMHGIWEIGEYLENPSGAVILKALRKNGTEGDLASTGTIKFQIITK